MSEENQSNEPKSELESLGVKPGETWVWLDKVNRFLTEAQPALLFVWGAATAVLAGFFTFLGFRAMSSPLIIESFQGGTSNGGGFLAASVFGVPAFLFGIAGTLLPMWAVGRLIADAVREGNTK